MRVVLAAGALAAMVPALAGAQQRPPAQQPRPATPPAQQPRPAAQPAQRPAAAPAAAAHREGSIELTGQVGVIGVSKGITGTTGTVMAPGGQIRVGYNFSQTLNASVGTTLGAGKSVSNSSTAYLFPSVALTWTPDLNRRTSPFVTVGGGLMYRKDSKTSAAGVQVGVGVRHMIGQALALRAEGLVQYVPKFSGVSSTGAGAALVGLSYFMGGGPPRDTDADGVPDKRDACPNTPRGATVDLRGCPSDSDHDGVLNGLDRCPNTPPNTPVTPDGCTRDSDNDGVADNLDRCPNTPANARPVDANGCPVDTDRDGVPDYLDRCANTAAGVPVDANGCPRDSDNDGVTDNLDRCPNTPANARPVDANGCPVDSDRDGVSDYLDRCANTAPNTQVDANGCPVLRDSDNDGVTDDRDRCPNTPAGARVDANGCPLREMPAVGASLVIQNIQFRGTTANILPASYPELDKVVAAIQATPDSRWELGGYTDNRGTPAANQRLSTARANAVMAYLVSKGIPAAQLTAVGYGPARPIAPNTTLANRIRNRRVEIKRIQ